MQRHDYERVFRIHRLLCPHYFFIGEGRLCCPFPPYPCQIRRGNTAPPAGVILPVGELRVVYARSSMSISLCCMCVSISFLHYLIVFWSQVVFYQFIYTLTRLPGEKPFSRIHYIFPLVIVGTFAVWSAFVPFETQVYIVTSREEVAPGYEAYSRFFTARLLLREIWNIAYTALAWWRLLAYRRSISDYSANADRTSLAWVTLLLLISFSLFLLLCFGHFLQKDTDSVAVAADSPIVAGSAARCGLLQYGCREFRGYLLSGRRNRNRIKGRCRNGNGKRN